MRNARAGPPKWRPAYCHEKAWSKSTAMTAKPRIASNSGITGRISPSTIGAADFALLASSCRMETQSSKQFGLYAIIEPDAPAVGQMFLEGHFGKCLAGYAHYKRSRQIV